MSFRSGQQRFYPQLCDTLPQSKLGTVIKCEDDVLGVTTVLPLASVAGARSLSDLGKFLLARVGPELKDRVQQVHWVQGCGELLCEG